MKTNKSHPVSVYILFFLLAFQGLSGTLGGILLVLDPTGRLIDLPISFLEGSPFHDYFIPGLILLILLGIYPLVVFYNLLRKKTWSWYGTLFVGLILVIWIETEILIIGYQSKPPLQAIYGLTAILIIIFNLMPSVRKYMLP